MEGGLLISCLIRVVPFKLADIRQHLLIKIDGVKLAPILLEVAKMPDFHLSINGQEQTVEDIDPSTPLLWVLRDNLGLVGTKFGCGGGFCGACTVHINGMAIRSCSVPVRAAVGKQITTIEGLVSDDGVLHPLQEAWIEEDVPQCGYCQSGQIMAAAALLSKNSTPDDSDINTALNGNLCRCGTYTRIRKAIHTAVSKSQNGGDV